ncbi:hypothetical protein B5M09_013821 [Aphanomyces astaci]|uniref:Uncharacterized protein n=1 Tax=Aphanomyces astaci TaxID=112090 RepID=A0A425D4L0_APHAT|nr:hypothetical protein B5M09_013821 [Aphanomyces astaci]
MSPTYDRTTILLDDKNWSTWRTFIKGRLMGNGLIHTLTQHSFYVSSDEVAEPKYRRDTQRALGIIIEHHEPQTHVDKIALLTEYHAISWELKGETLSSFIERFQNLVRKLRDAGCAEDEYMTVAKLLALMPWCLRIVLHQINLMHENLQTVTVARTLLEAEYKAVVANGALQAPGNAAGETRVLGAMDGGRG